MKLTVLILTTLFVLGPAGRPLAGEDDNHHPGPDVPSCVYPSAG